MSLVMEYSPKAFADLGEEALRFHFLVQLNGQYEGEATGETFNGEGKSDIIIRQGGANVFKPVGGVDINSRDDPGGHGIPQLFQSRTKQNRSAVSLIHIGVVRQDAA